MRDALLQSRIGPRIGALYYVSIQVVIRPNAMTEAHARLVFTRVPLLIAELKEAETGAHSDRGKEILKGFRDEFSVFPTYEEALSLPRRRVVEEIGKVFRLTTRVAAALELTLPELTPGRLFTSDYTALTAEEPLEVRPQ